MAPAGGGGEGSGALSELMHWVCIRVPRGPVGGTSVLMDAPYGRFAVLVPLGLAPGTPLLVPVPAAGAPTQIGAAHSPRRHANAELEAAREAQLQALIERYGIAAAEAAQYCDGVTPVEELVETIQTDAAALEHTDLDAEVATVDEVATPRSGGSHFCVVS